MTNQSLREQLFAKITTSKHITELKENGIPQRNGINSIQARAVGFNARGNFQVQRERVEGGKVIWQRHYSKGCPELMEYIARYSLVTGESHSVKPEDYIKGIERGLLVYNEFVPNILKTRGAEEGCVEAAAFRDWLNDGLPEWGELYTPNGLNYVAIMYLYKLVTGDRVSLKPAVIMQMCDSHESPYKIRFCQGVPSKAGSNDDWPSLFRSELVLLCGADVLKDPYEAPLEPPMVRPTCPLVDLISDLEAELAEAKCEAARNHLIEELAFLLDDESVGRVELPDTMEAIEAMTKLTQRAISLQNELASYKPSQKEWI
ncbi:hypothetical protein VPHD124_0185 [Vibrio phage D124]